MKKTLVAMLVGAFASVSFGGEQLQPLPQIELPSIKVFDKEGQVDLAGSYRRGGRADWGYMVRGNYFFNESVGFGVEFADLGTYEPTYSTGLNVYFRAPVEDLRLAPYVVLGAGYAFGDLDDLYFSAGAGIDWRVFGDWGVFAEGAAQWVHDNDQTLQVRAGLKYTF